MKMRKTKKFLITLLLVFSIIFATTNLPAIADFGDFDSYDSSSSDWDSGSDWSSSSSSWDWDDDDDYSYSGSSRSHYSSSSSEGSVGGFFFTLLVIIIIVILVKKYGKNGNIGNVQNMSRMGSLDPFAKDDKPIEYEIQQGDPNFNKSEFLSWASDLFVKLQYAWSDRNLEPVRPLMTTELYEQTEDQVQRYIKNKQINKLERVSVNIAKLYSYEVQGEKDCVSVILKSKMIDYIINEDTGAVENGDKNTNKINAYVLTFVRDINVKSSQSGEVSVGTMNCPNCGAPTTILSSGKCPYCGSIITTKDHSWSLSSLKRYTSGM